MYFRIEGLSTKQKELLEMELLRYDVESYTVRSRQNGVEVSCADPDFLSAALNAFFTTEGSCPHCGKEVREHS
jgi:hypothetical protein